MAVLNQLGSFALPLHINLIFAAIGGFLLGLYYEILGFRAIKRLPFILRLLLQLLIVQLIIMGAALTLDACLAVFGYKLPGGEFRSNMFSEANLPTYFRAQIFMFILLFVFEIEMILGRNFLLNYLLGKYDKPKKEHRVFMFLDLTGSTGLAERLGDDKYYQLLNDCYRLLSKPIINTRAEVLKYVGDEVILSWPYERGLTYNNCIELYYAFQKTLKTHEAGFIANYGVLPHFKAGVHDGVVVAAYLGEFKKQLDFSGDVMNSTARIVGSCGLYQSDLLVSAQLYDALPLRIYHAERISDAELKGKTTRMNLVKITGRQDVG
jgi:adenylate cyclase